jgi:hypothetical protein
MKSFNVSKIIYLTVLPSHAKKYLSIYEASEELRNSFYNVGCLVVAFNPARKCPHMAPMKDCWLNMTIMHRQKFQRQKFQT